MVYRPLLLPALVAFFAPPAPNLSRVRNPNPPCCRPLERRSSEPPQQGRRDNRGSAHGRGPKKSASLTSSSPSFLSASSSRSSSSPENEERDTRTSLVEGPRVDAARRQDDDHDDDDDEGCRRHGLACKSRTATSTSTSTATSTSAGVVPSLRRVRVRVLVDRRWRSHGEKDAGRSPEKEEDEHTAAKAAAAERLAARLGLPLVVVLAADRAGDCENGSSAMETPAGGAGAATETRISSNDLHEGYCTHELQYVPWRRSTVADHEATALELRTLTPPRGTAANKKPTTKGAASWRSRMRTSGDRDGMSMVVDWVRILYGTAPSDHVGSPVDASPSLGRPGKDRLVQAVWGRGGRGGGKEAHRRRQKWETMTSDIDGEEPRVDAASTSDHTAGDREEDARVVVDLTAGWGTDAITLLLADPANRCHVVMVERDPIVAEMLRDAHRRLKRHEQDGKAESPLPPTTTTADDGRPSPSFAERITVLEGDGAEVATRCVAGEFTASSSANAIMTTPDVVYLDPMFPPRTKSAAVKKPMQLLHSLLISSSHGPGAAASGAAAGAASSSPSPHREESYLLEAARRWARERVVVKRPLKAEPLGGVKPRFSLVGGSHRWDVYLTRPST